MEKLFRSGERSITVTIRLYGKQWAVNLCKIWVLQQDMWYHQWLDEKQPDELLFMPVDLRMTTYARKRPP